MNPFKRPTDVLARYGGEEFCVVISGNENEAMETAEMLRKSVESLNIMHNLSITISIGVTSGIPSQNDNIENFIEHSDQALYKSKETCRDRISLYK